MKNLHDFLNEQEIHTLPINKQKNILRKQLLNLREETHKNTTLENWGPYQFFRTLELLKIHSLKDLENKYIIASFFPIKHELDLSIFANKNWIFPRIHKDKELLWFEYGDGETNYIVNKYGIKEKEEKFCFRYAHDFLPILCFMPGLAAAQDGSRLGYGGGFYDKFLCEFKSKITSVLCLPSKEFLFNKLPCEEFDEKVDLVVF